MCLSHDTPSHIPSSLPLFFFPSRSLLYRSRTEEECLLLLQGCRMTLKYPHKPAPTSPPKPLPAGGGGAVGGSGGGVSGGVRYKYLYAIVSWNDAFVGCSKMVPFPIGPLSLHPSTPFLPSLTSLLPLIHPMFIHARKWCLFQ